MWVVPLAALSGWPDLVCLLPLSLRFVCSPLFRFFLDGHWIAIYFFSPDVSPPEVQALFTCMGWCAAVVPESAGGV